ncbi:11946_t:CDS:2, partial [Funneliformis geosporum]
MSPKNKKTQNEELVVFLKTRNQKRKQEDDILISDTLAKKTKTPAKRYPKKNTKEFIIEALNDGDNGKIQKPAPAAKRALNDGDNGKIQEIMVTINQKENNKVRDNDE